MRQYFLDLAARLDGRIRDGEEYQCWLEAESSDFVRFNRSAIRQPGHVRQIYLTLTLFDGLRPEAEQAKDYQQVLDKQLSRLGAKYGREKIAADFLQITTHPRNFQ